MLELIKFRSSCGHFCTIGHNLTMLESDQNQTNKNKQHTGLKDFCSIVHSLQRKILQVYLVNATGMSWKQPS